MESEGSLPHSQVPATCPILSHLDPVHTPISHFLKVYFNIIIHLCLGLPSGLFLLGFPTKTMYKSLLSPISATCTTHLIRIDFITRTIFGGEYRSLSSLFCSFLHAIVTSSLLGQNILHNTIFSNTPSLCSSLNINDHVSQPYKPQAKLYFCIS